jgi:hypothetical protein
MAACTWRGDRAPPRFAMAQPLRDPQATAVKQGQHRLVAQTLPGIAVRIGAGLDQQAARLVLTDRSRRSGPHLGSPHQGKAGARDTHPAVDETMEGAHRRQGLRQGPGGQLLSVRALTLVSQPGADLGGRDCAQGLDSDDLTAMAGQEIQV